MRIADYAADLGGGLNDNGRPAVFDNAVVCSADYAADLVIGKHLAGNADVSYGAAPALAEKSGHVDEVGYDIQSRYGVSAAVKISAEICNGGYALVVVERRSYGNPARTFNVDPLSRYVDVIGQVEVCILCGVALLNVLRQKSELVAGGYAVVSSGQSIRFAVVKLGHGCRAFIDHIIRIIRAVNLFGLLAYIFEARRIVKIYMRREASAQTGNAGRRHVLLPVAHVLICAERIDPIVERVENLERFLPVYVHAVRESIVSVCDLKGNVYAVVSDARRSGDVGVIIAVVAILHGAVYG